MSRLELSRTYLLVVVLTVLQPVLFAASGHLSGVSSGGAAFVAFLLGWLAFGSTIAWTLLVVMNLVPILAVLGFALGSAPWSWSGGVWLALLTGALLEAALMSPAMRGQLGGPRAARQGRRSQPG